MRSFSTLFLRAFIFVALIGLGSGQPAPQRSNELCSLLKQSALEQSKQFIPDDHPGACRMGIDYGYTFFVDYSDRRLYVGLTVIPALFNGNSNAFWLRLSALDNLAHSALGTRQQIVFDGLNTLSKKLAAQQLKHGTQGTGLLKDTGLQRSRAQRAELGARFSSHGIIVLMASADSKDIDKMKNETVEVSSWRRILGLSLQAFAAGAQSSSQAYSSYAASSPQRTLTPIRSCYTNFLGAAAVTTCY